MHSIFSVQHVSSESRKTSASHWPYNLLQNILHYSSVKHPTRTSYQHMNLTKSSSFKWITSLKYKGSYIRDLTLSGLSDWPASGTDCLWKLSFPLHGQECLIRWFSYLHSTPGSPTQVGESLVSLLFPDHCTALEDTPWSCVGWCAPYSGIIDLQVVLYALPRTFKPPNSKAEDGEELEGKKHLTLLPLPVLRIH